MKKFRQRFSPDEYKKLLDKIRLSGFKFMTFGEPAGNTPKRVYLRHDVDLCLEAAFNIAVLEHSKFVKSTFFIMIRSEFYNIYSNESIRYINKIHRLGHGIGLHFHPGETHGKNKNVIHKEIKDEFNALTKIVSSRLEPYFSIHNPTNIDINHDQAPFIFVHDIQHFGEVKYISDSRMFFREGDPVDVFTSATHNIVQLLIHPIFWYYGGENLEDSLKNYRDNCIKNIKKHLYEDFNGSLKNT